jgi:hypothetical protein
VSVTPTVAAGVRAIRALLAQLEAAGIAASRDASKFFPQPVGVLVGLPELVGRGMYARTFTVAVLVVSGDPLNSEFAVDRLLALADEVASALATDSYRPSSWRGNVNAEPLPAYLLDVTVTVTETDP